MLFPEGGNLVSGISSRITFKATDGKGLPIEVEGTLFENGKVLRQIKSSHQGMGVTYFTPFIDRKYQILLNDGSSHSLPEIYANGMTLTLHT